MSPLFALIFCGAWLGTVSDAAAPDAQMAALVQKLGDKSYAVRSAAARDLVAAGSRAIPALTAGNSHADLEIAQRCGQLLPLAAEAGRKYLLAKLLDDPAGPPPKGLAGLERFLNITGDNGTARKLYAEMMATQPQLVEALETKPKEAARLFAAFANGAIDRARVDELAGQDPYSELLTSRGEVALFLFVRSDARFDDTQTLDDTGYVGWKTMELLRASRFKSAVAGPEAAPGMKKLFLRWLAVERQEDEMHTAYDIAKEGKMAEAVPLALRFVNDREKGPCFRAHLILDFLAAMGTKDQIKDLARLLSDDSGLGSLQVDDGPVLAPQVRDVALAVSIRLAGQKPADFGFHAGGFEAKEYHEYYGGYGFIDAAAREAAQAKWRAWAKGKETRERK